MSLKDKLKQANQKSQASENVTKLKLQTLLDPADPKGWFMLGENLLKLGQNQSAWKCLTTAKKLGSMEATMKISQILQNYNQQRAGKGQKAHQMLLGEGEA